MKRERGQAFILVLILLAVGALLIVPILHTAYIVVKSRSMYGQFIMEDYAADAAVEYGMWRLKYEPGFAESLPIGTESDPFYITLNGITANTTVMAQALESELSGQALAGRADGEIQFKVEKTVVATTTYATLAADGFESDSGSGGTGSWNDNWVFSGSWDINQTGEHEGSYHLLLQGDDNETPGDGYAEREVDLSGSTGMGPYLTFWARVSSFESYNNDEAYVKVSTDGETWDILRTFVDGDDDDQYHQYQFDLSSYGEPSSLYIAFQTSLSSTYDYFYVDDIKFINAVETTTIEPGVETLYTYTVTIQCVDPDGATLDRIVDELPTRGASSGDYLQYVPGSTDWDMVAYDSFAYAGFETSGDTGPWIGGWTLSGDSSITTSGEFEGDRCLQLLGDGDAYPGDGYAQREINLSGTTGSGPYLYFWALIEGIEQGNTIDVRVSTNGVDWDVLETFDYLDMDNQYRQHWYDLSDYGRPATFYVSFRMNGDHYSDTFLLDAVEFSGYQGATSGEWPVPPFDPTDIDIVGDYSDRQQVLEWDFENAGYYDIAFDYGETRTISFQAEAALTEGTYCNKIWVSDSSYGDEGEVVSGTTAKIIVGDPEDTNCDGGLLKVEKASDPEIVYPYEPTTVTYTITIENVDTIPIQILEIEDWLPATGSLVPAEGFIYVDNSAQGRIIGRDSYPVLFYDPFNRSDSYTVSYWTDSDGGGSNAQISSESVYMRQNASITKSAISTAGHTGIVLSYSWSGDYDCESTDKLLVQWKPSASGTWNTLAQHALDTTSWHDASSNLPAEANNTQIDIRFTGNTSQSDEYGRLDNVQVRSNVPTSSTPVCMPDDNEGSDFLYEDWEGDYPYYQYRWSLTWDFEDYPQSGDYVWDPGALCDGYPYNDYNPYLELQPGEIFEIVFQASGTLTYSGSYFNEVFVRIDYPGLYGDDWLYSWPTGTVIVPQYDLQAETLNSILRANALLSELGHWWRSYDWWRRR